MATVLVTGASRGLGPEFTRQYLAEGHTVIAAARDPGAHVLQQLEPDSRGRLTLAPVDLPSYKCHLTGTHVAL